jgi:hypothetical protein
MSPGEYMKAIASFLAFDQALQLWCRENLGKELVVQVGVDENNPPAVDTYPIAILVSCVEERGNARTQSFVLRLGCGLYNDTITTEGPLTIYDGIVDAADFCNQVEAAIFRSGPGTFEVIGDEIPISFHPLHTTNTSVRCELGKSSRRPVR